MKPEISVVIPLYNKERYIRRTINSVLRQTFQNFECIVVDSSTDTSTDIIRQYSDPRIIHITRDRTKAAPARNLGAHYASTDYIAFLDADDEWLPDHLDSLISLRKIFPDAGLYSTPYVKLKSDGRPMVMLFYGIPCPPWEGYMPDYLLTCSRGDEPVNSSSCAIPRHIFDSMGGFPENLVYGEDQFLWGKISLTYPVAYSWKGLTIYHTDAQGRICDEIHAIREHPFSEYLKRELTAGNIPPDKQGECRAYIWRKRYSEIFSKLIHGREPVSCEGTPGPVRGPFIGLGEVESKSNGFMKIISRFFSYFYHSSLHDSIRRCLCKIYGCYDPGQLLRSGKNG